jgi:hypothetical protein
LTAPLLAPADSITEVVTVFPMDGNASRAEEVKTDVTITKIIDIAEVKRSFVISNGIIDAYSDGSTIYHLS